MKQKYEIWNNENEKWNKRKWKQNEKWRKKPANIKKWYEIIRNMK